MSDADQEAIVAQAAAQIMPMLAGHMLADLVSIWLCAHRGPPGEIEQLREQLLAAHIELVRQLVPVNEAIMFGAPLDKPS